MPIEDTKCTILERNNTFSFSKSQAIIRNASYYTYVYIRYLNIIKMSGHLYWIQKCYSCKKHFREISNFGNWNCNKHTGNLVLKRFEDIRDLVKFWDCCNTSPTPYVYCTNTNTMKKNPYFKTKGCTRCDHFTAADGPSSSLILEKDWNNIWVSTFKEEIKNGKIRPGLRASNQSQCSSLCLYRICPEKNVSDLPGNYLFPKIAEKKNREYVRSLSFWATYI